MIIIKLKRGKIIDEENSNKVLEWKDKKYFGFFYEKF